VTEPAKRAGRSRTITHRPGRPTNLGADAASHATIGEARASPGQLVPHFLFTHGSRKSELDFTLHRHAGVSVTRGRTMRAKSGRLIDNDHPDRCRAESRKQRRSALATQAASRGREQAVIRRRRASASHRDQHRSFVAARLIRDGHISRGYVRRDRSGNVPLHRSVDALLRTCPRGGVPSRPSNGEPGRNPKGGVGRWGIFFWRWAGSFLSFSLGVQGWAGGGGGSVRGGGGGGGGGVDARPGVEARG